MVLKGYGEPVRAFQNAAGEKCRDRVASQSPAAHDPQATAAVERVVQEVMDQITELGVLRTGMLF